MIRRFCDGCNFELEKGEGVRVFPYGNAGVTATPAYKAVRSTDNEKLFCSGECMIRNVDFLGGVLARKLQAERGATPEPEGAQ